MRCGRLDPERVKVLDVRMVEEYVFLGHAEGAVNIPVAFPKYQWHADKRKYGFEINPDFIDHVKEVFKPDDTIVAMCRSGGRSAAAINMLAKAGFTNIYNIIDGFEGDTVDDPESVYHGKRMKNGWKNSAPWTYDLDPRTCGFPRVKNWTSSAARWTSDRTSDRPHRAVQAPFGACTALSK